MKQGELAVSGPQGLSRVYDEPGVHSYNLQRRRYRDGHSTGGMVWLRRVLLLGGLLGLGLWGYSVAEETVYQSYANWAFDQQIAGHSVTFLDYISQLVGLSRSTEVVQKSRVPAAPLEARGPQPGEMLGRVIVPRLNMSAVVLEGVDDGTLRRSAGHVPYTALPGETGNFSIAAHRDTLFRPLKDIRIGDEVQFATAQKILTFRVVSTRIVNPTDVSVLAPESDSKLMTMITCYPFYYVGSAPKRFIVKARLDPQANAASQGAVPASPFSAQVGGSTADSPNAASPFAPADPIARREP